MSEFPEERLLIQNLWERFHKDYLKVSEIAQYDGLCDAGLIKQTERIDLYIYTTGEK